MPAPVGTIFAELDLDASRYLKSQKRLLQDATRTTLNIEQNFKNLGIKSAAEMNLMRAKIENSFNRIKNSSQATANDIIRAEKAKNEQLKAIDRMQFGERISMIEKVKQHWIQALAAIYAMQRTGMFLKSAIDEAERMENSLRGLAGVARYAGANISQSIMMASKLAEDGLIDVASASRALQNLLARGYSLQESIDMLTRLKDAAAFNRQGHLSMAEAVVTATEGLKNENSILVDNAGVTKNVSVMWKEYALEIGKGVGQLTQAEKRQAEYNGIMKETEAQVGNAKLATEGLMGAKARLNVEVIKLKASLGNSLTPAFLELAKAANWTLQNAIIPFIGGIEILSTKSAGLFDKAVLWTKIKSLESSQWAVEDTKKKAENERLIASMKAELNRVDSVVSAQIDDIMKKWSGLLAIPEIGRDSGKRRQDVVSGGNLLGGSGKSTTSKDEGMFGENSLQGTPLMRQLIDMEELYDRQFKEREANEQRDLDLKEKQKALLESIKTPFEEYNKQVALANELMQAGLLSADQYDRAMAKAREVFKDTTAQETESMKALQQAIEGWGRESADAIVEFCVEGKTSFSDMIKSMIKDMLKMMVYQNLMKPLFGGDGQTGWIQSGVSLIGSLFGGGYSDPNTPGMFARGAAFNRGHVTAFSHGGVVSKPTLFPMANGMGLMGEAGPEAVMPLKRTSSGRLGVEGGGMTISVPVTINGDASKGMAAKLSRAIEETVRKTVKDLM